MIESHDEATLRPTDDIAKRAIALLIVAIYAEDANAGTSPEEALSLQNTIKDQFGGLLIFYTKRDSLFARCRTGQAYGHTVFLAIRMS